MTTNPPGRGPLSRRVVVIGGVLALVALFVGGAVVNVPRIQRDLRHRASAALDLVGVSARVDFVGQDATLRCADPLVDPDLAGRAVRQVRGVRSVQLDASCRRGPGVTPSSPEPSTAPSSPDAAPPDTAAPDTSTTSASTTSTTSTTSTVPTPADLVAVQLGGGALTLSGAVATQAQHQQLVDAATGTVEVANLSDSLAVDPSVAVTDADVAALATLMPVMSKPLALGRIGKNEAGLFATGVAISDTAMGTFERAASAVGVVAALTVRPNASPADVTAVAARLNAIVAATPIVFAKGNATLDPSAAAVLQRVAGVAKEFGGVVIEVQGHTDSVGDPARNQALSTQRAQRVRTALVTLGVPPADLTAKGFGSTQPITDNNGAELPDQSRRVVFGVTSR